MMVCHRVVGTAKGGMCKSPGWMTREPMRTKAGGWEEDDHQDQKADGGSWGSRSTKVLPSIFPSSREHIAPRCLASETPPHETPCLLLLNKATGCLAVDPQSTPLARADFLPAAAVYHLRRFHTWLAMRDFSCRPSVSGTAPEEGPELPCSAFPDCTNPLTGSVWQLKKKN